MTSNSDLILINKYGNRRDLGAILDVRLSGGDNGPVLGSLPTLPYVMSGVNIYLVSGYLFIIKNGRSNRPSTSILAYRLKGGLR